MFDRLPSWFPRAALLAALAIWWLNFALTSRWAAVPGSIHGAKQWAFLAALGSATALALTARKAGAVDFRREARLTAGVCGATLLGCFAIWFPPSTWTQIPFLDNWPARFQSTVDGIALLKRVAVAGWHWAFLGGYHASSDLPVTLTVPA